MKWTRRNFLFSAGLGAAAICRRPAAAATSYSRARDIGGAFPGYDPRIELKLDNLVWNLNRIRAKTGRPVMAVVKANGYGHGLKPVGQTLDKAGIHAQMVCKLDEALALREAGVVSPILNFGPFDPRDAEVLVKNGIAQSVFTDKVRHLSSAARKLNRPAAVHIHIDTGMGRMGVPYHEAFPYLERTAGLPKLKVEGISTTLTEDPEFDREQIRRLLELCRPAREKGLKLGLRHAASSGGLFGPHEFYLDMVRPGIALYGYYPSDRTQSEDSLDLRPVLELKCRVAAVKTLRPGDSVSYHRLYTARKTEKIAVLPIGYSDGFPFNIVGKGSVLIGGRRIPLIGDVTSNHLEVRLDPKIAVSQGDEAVLIGRQGEGRITAYEVSQWAEISVYKLLLRLNPLLPKRILHSD